MKKKIGIILVCIILIIYTIPVLGLAEEQSIATIIDQDPDQSYRLKVKHLDNGRLPPDPGEIPDDFSFELHNNIQINSNPPERTMTSTDEPIIEIIQNLDDDLILGYLEDITDFGPRVTGSNACQQAGEYIYNEFESYGLEARYADWSYSSYSGNNIEGTLYGINETSDDIYIICAHYDSVSGSPGADDDGSGTAAVLAAAYLMSQYTFNHTIRFVAFDGEEQGLLGSYEYAEESSNNGDNIVAALNGDMIGYAENPTQASYIKIYENSASEWITDFTEDVSQLYYDYIELEIVPSGPAYNSDHASFWDFGYHAIMYHEYEFNQYYHSSQDTIENMNVNYSTRVSRLMTATLGELAETQILNYPPETPIITGPTTGHEGEELTFSTSTTDPEEDNIYYKFDWGDGNYSDWIGPYNSGETAEESNIWDEIGTYEIRVKAKDVNNKESDWSEQHTVTIVENRKPTNPTINGPNIGFGGKEYEFTFVSTDPDGHDIYYKVRWDDGSDTGWLGTYSSGETITLSHSWNKKGTYWIKAWAKDTFEGKSSQASFKINILTNKAKSTQRYINPLFLQALENLMNRFPMLRYLLE